MKAERPLAVLIIGNLPKLPAPGRKRPPTCPERGRKGESSDVSGLYRGAALAMPAPLCKFAVIHQARVSAADRCYEPRGANSVGRDWPLASEYHEFVIFALRRNNLKTRPK